MRTHMGTIPLENCIAPRTVALRIGITIGGGALVCTIINITSIALIDRRSARGVR